MNTQYSATRPILAIALALPLLDCLPILADETNLESPRETALSQAPTFNGQQLLLAGTGMRGRQKTSIFSFGSKLSREDGTKFVDPEFEDFVGPAGKAEGTVTPRSVGNPAGTSKPATTSTAKTATKSPATAASGKSSATVKSATSPKPAAAKAPKPSVEKLLQEMYTKDGREMPDMNYKPVPADNPAVRAARVKRGLPAVPSKTPEIETVPVSDVELALDEKPSTNAVKTEGDEFFPADSKTNAAAPQENFFPADQSAVVENTTTVPATRNVSAIFDIEPVTEPIADTELSPVMVNVPAQTVGESLGLDIPDEEIRIPQIPINAPTPTATIAATPRNDSQKTARPTAPATQQRVARSAKVDPLPSVAEAISQPETFMLPSIVRALPNGTTVPVDVSKTQAAPAAKGWKAASETAVAEADLSEGKAIETAALPPAPLSAPAMSAPPLSADPIANAFIDDDASIAANESLDIAPKALDVTEESAGPMDALVNRENLTGLKGFCPVTLCEHRDLIDADPRYSAVYQDRTYYVSSYDALMQFQEQPEKYAPVLGGIDVVHRQRNNTRVDGILDHAAWYRGKLYLFETARTLAEFSADPKAYSVN